MIDALTAIIVAAVVLGSLYALLAGGLSLIWNTLGVFNYAHGGLLILGGYFIWTLAVPVGLPVIVAFLIALPIMAVVGMVLELAAVRPLLRRPNGQLLVMVSTLAVGNVIQGLTQVLWGPLDLKIPAITAATVPIGNVRVAVTSVIALGLALVLIIGLIVLLTRTEWGASIRAVEQNREMALLVGVRPKRVYATVFAIAAVLACAGALVYGTTSTLTPNAGTGPLLTAFVVLVFGGSATLWGTLVGSFAIGLLDSATSYWLGLQWSPVFVFLALVIIMLVRPEGLVKGRSK